jgi:anti-sigma factor RsiW
MDRGVPTELGQLEWTMKCRECVALLADYIDADLSDRNRRAVTMHLDECRACSSYWAKYRSTVALVRTAHRDVAECSPSESFIRRVLASVTHVRTYGWH